MRFTKMQALGNDFIVVNATEENFTASPEKIRQWADRHHGIGFDQCLVLEKPTDSTADFFYRVFNADGNEVAQCGNGARCVTLYAQQNKLTEQDKITLQTQNGMMHCQLVAPDQVQVDMGEPNFDPASLPTTLSVGEVGTEIPLGNDSIHASLVSVGNPHAVILVDEVSAAPVAELGEVIGQLSYFPEGVNVGFMQIDNEHQIQLRVYERGAGETQACGSGACAATAVGRQQGLLSEKVTVQLRGGTLTIEWPGTGHSLMMSGKAQSVYDGVIQE